MLYALNKKNRIKTAVKKNVIKRYQWFICMVIFNTFPTQQVVGWSSWLWHMLNTHNVPSSILGSIILIFFLKLRNLHIYTLGFHSIEIYLVLIEKGIYFYVVGRDRNLFSMVHLDPSGNNFLSGTFEIGNHFNKT